MHDEVLNDAQRRLLPLMAQFRREYISKLAEHIGWQFYPHDRFDVDI